MSLGYLATGCDDKQPFQSVQWMSYHELASIIENLVSDSNFEYSRPMQNHRIFTMLSKFEQEGGLLKSSLL